MVAIAVCDPRALRAALSAGTVDRTGGLRVSVPGRRSVAGGGVVQVPGQPLRGGTSMTVTGKASRDTQLVVHARSGNRIVQSTFDALGLEAGGRAVLRLTVGGGTQISLRRPDGRSVLPVLTRRLRW